MPLRGIINISREKIYSELRTVQSSIPSSDWKFSLEIFMIHMFQPHGNFEQSRERNVCTQLSWLKNVVLCKIIN